MEKGKRHKEEDHMGTKEDHMGTEEDRIEKEEEVHIEKEKDDCMERSKRLIEIEA